jgi:NAD(P)-dependent dehydrogenase (short-subunit alcohol dehydrogenase family)
VPESLSDRVVLIAGATGGLGAAVTREFAQTEARLVLTSYSEPALYKLVGGLGLSDERVFAPVADLTRPSEAQELVETTLSRFGRLDVLLNTVGGWAGGQPVARSQGPGHGRPDDGLQIWQRMLALNLNSAFFLSWAVLPPMLEAGWGRIVHVASRTALQPRPKVAGYAVSKMGVITLAEVIAAEAKGTGVTANVLLPSTIDTPDNRRMMPKADPEDWVPPEHIAATMRFLCSEAASSINGARIAVYGAV